MVILVDPIREYIIYIMIKMLNSFVNIESYIIGTSLKEAGVFPAKSTELC